MTAMPQIETVVMLMLENRSLDTMLGWLYEDGIPHQVYPPGSNPRFNGIRPGAANRRGSATVSPTRGSEGARPGIADAALGPEGRHVPRAAPAVRRRRRGARRPGVGTAAR